MKGLEVWVLVAENDNGRYGTDSTVRGVFATEQDAIAAGNEFVRIGHDESFAVDFHRIGYATT